MPGSGVTIRLVDSLPVGQHRDLYVEAGWWKCDQDESTLPRLVAGSFLVAAAFGPDGALVGMGRMISDGVSDGYVQDVVVSARYRGLGIGADIVGSLVDEGKRRGLRWIGLVAAPGTRGFYEKLGFAVMPDHLPMLLGLTDADGDAP